MSLETLRKKRINLYWELQVCKELIEDAKEEYEVLQASAYVPPHKHVMVIQKRLGQRRRKRYLQREIAYVTYELSQLLQHNNQASRSQSKESK